MESSWFATGGAVPPQPTTACGLQPRLCDLGKIQGAGQPDHSKIPYDPALFVFPALSRQAGLALENPQQPSNLERTNTFGSNASSEGAPVERAWRAT